MGYLASMVDPLFKTTASGQRAFFPFGVLGRGRVLPDEQTERAIRRITKWLYGLSWILLALFAVKHQDWLVLFGSVWGMLAIYYAIIYAKIRGLPLADERMGWIEAYRRSARGMGKRTCWVICLVCTVLAGLAALAAATMDAGWSETLPMVAFAGLVLAGAIFFGWLARLATQES